MNVSPTCDGSNNRVFSKIATVVRPRAESSAYGNNCVFLRFARWWAVAAVVAFVARKRPVMEISKNSGGLIFHFVIGIAFYCGLRTHNDSMFDDKDGVSLARSLSETNEVDCAEVEAAQVNVFQFSSLAAVGQHRSTR